MKRWIAGILAVAVLGTIVVAVPRPAVAGGWHHGSGSGNFWGGFAVGAITGVVAGAFVPRPVYVAPPVVYQPAPVYYQPAPVYYQPAPAVVYQAPPAQPVYYQPAPVCSNYWVNGYWYGPNWVAGHWEQACR